MTTELIAAFSGGITSIQGDVIALLIVVVPLALVLFGIMFAIRWGKRGFKVLSK